jgi:hypothetical protein
MKQLISTDLELMAAYRAGNDAGDGEVCGEENDSPREAAEREDWTVIRSIYEGTNEPGTPVLADDGAGALYVVCDVNGPWAVRVGGDR